MPASDNCTVLVASDATQQLTEPELKEMIEKGSTADKIVAMKELIATTLNGEAQQKNIMSVIKFISPVGTTTSTKQNADPLARTLKKLTLYYWEIVDKRDSQGKPLPEMMLLVDLLRRDLSHPNEFIRGATLRFLCNLKEKDILEPLATTVLDNLDHRQSYIRRNAVLAITNIFQRAPEALPHAPEAVQALLQHECVDVTTKRNAFLMLFKCKPDMAVQYLRTVVSDLGQTNDVFQLAVVELLKQLMQTNPREKSQYIRIIFTLLQSKSQSVLYQCASTLLALSSSPTAIKASATTLASLLNASGDNNVKMVVVGKLEEIKARFPESLHGLTMDMLRCLSGAEHEIQRRILDLTHDLVTAKNVEKVMAFLKKELVESSGTTEQVPKGEASYRQMLIRFISQTALRHRVVAQLVTPILMDFIIETSKSASDTILFIREMVQRQPELRHEVVEKLTLQFSNITSTRVFRVALWILSTHASSYEDVRNVLNTLRETLEPFPLWLKEEEQEEDAPLTGSGAVVRADGTYGQAEVEVKEEAKETTTLRSLITGGDFFLSAVVANTCVKLTSTCLGLNISQQYKDSVRKEAMKIVDELLSVGVHKGVDQDSHERLRQCKKMLEHPHTVLMQRYTQKMLEGYSALIAEEDEIARKEKTEEEKKFVPVDAPLHFTQLVKTKKGENDALVDLEDVTLATKNEARATVKRPKNVVQLAGFDPVYVEGTVEVNQFDIVLELFVVNKSKDTLQNLTIELGTRGDMRLCDRPQSHRAKAWVPTLAPGEETTVSANMKLSLTEEGVIFGNLVFDSSRPGSDQTVIVLNDLHIDIIDYVHPATCNATTFRSMWEECEWENPLVVSTEITSLRGYLDHVLKVTNMQCQATTSLAGEADFLSANLMAKSSFGEPVVANLSISKGPSGKIEGYVRIRSRSQGIALGLGDKIIS